jgi:hypothetical protein
MDSSNYPMPREDQGEMTLRELIVRFREYASEIKRNWLLILFICLPFLVWQGYVALNTPTQYDAGLTFMVDEETNGSSGMLGSLLGDFGLGGSESNFDKILELSKSQRIMRMALFTKIEVDGQKDFLANHIIRIQKLQEEDWNKAPTKPGTESLNNFFFQRDNFEQFNRVEYAAFKSLYGLLLGDEKHTALFRTKYNQDSGVMSMGMTTRSESLSIVLLRTIFEQLSTYYILTSTKKEKVTYDILKEKTDSIHRLLIGSEYREAAFTDQNLGLLRSTDELPKSKYARNKSMYTLMYGEALRNLEIADFAIQDRTPYIEAIDLPVPPLSGYGYGKKKALGLGLGLGLFLSIAFIVLRKIINNQLS